MSEFITASEILESGHLPSPVNSVGAGRKIEVEALFVTPLKHNEMVCNFNIKNTSILKEAIPRLPMQLSTGEPIFPEIPKSRSSCLRRNSRSASESRRNPTRWNAEEDELLRELVNRHGSRKWKEIAREFSQQSSSPRTDIQCLHRYNKCLRPGLLKGPWSPEEDAIILEQVTRHGKQRIKWTQIANKLCGRLGKQVRERWINHLDPTLNHSPWTVDEDAKLYLMQRSNGNKWKKIAQALPGRSENAVKNRFHSLNSLYHLPAQDEQLNVSLLSKPSWLEARRIKKTRKYKQRKPRLSRRYAKSSDSGAVKGIKRTRSETVHNGFERNINIFESDPYPTLDFTDDNSKLPFLDPSISFKGPEILQTMKVTNSARVQKIHEKLLPGLVTFTSMPSPFANTESARRRNSNPEVFVFKTAEENADELYQREIGNQILLSNYVNPPGAKIALTSGCQQSLSQIAQPIGLGSCFQLNSQGGKDFHGTNTGT